MNCAFNANSAGGVGGGLNSYESSSPILADCIAYFEGRIVDRFRPGNHTLFFAEVVDAGVMAEGQPLSSFDYTGQYLGKE